MTHSKRTVIVFTLAALLGSNAMTAFAQETTVAPAITAEQPAGANAEKPGFFAKMKAKFGGRDGGRRGGGEMLEKIMIEVDADKNGSVTQDEINAFRAAKVGAADVSKDGVLSLEEFSTAYNQLMRARMVDAFQKLDADGDGNITTAELDARFGNIVAKMDRNGDGTLSKADRPQHVGKGKGGKRNGNNQSDDNAPDNL